MSRRLTVLWVMLFAMLSFPRNSDARIFEFIWEMSGPQMFGVGGSCVYSFQLKVHECKVGAATFATLNGGNAPLGPFLVLGGSLMTSTPRDSKTADYGWFDASLVSFEPGLAVSSRDKGNGLRIAHGAGITNEVLFGNAFRRFYKFGYTITPLEVAYGKVAVAAKIRIYPDGFTDDEFGFGPRLNFNRPAEATYGVSISYIWR